MAQTRIISPVPPKAVISPTKSPFPDQATILTGTDTNNTNLSVATAAPDTTQPAPIGSFTSDKIQIWIFCVNAIAANVNSLSRLADSLQNEVEGMNKPAWKASIDQLSLTLQTVVQQSDKLCNDTTAKL